MEQGYFAVSSGISYLGYSPLYYGRDKEIDKEYIKKNYPVLASIIDCESSWRPNVCSYAGCGLGQGLGQIIPSTLRYCEKKLGRKLDVFDEKDNLECCLWLYENEGVRHWDSSKKCWNK